MRLVVVMLTVLSLAGCFTSSHTCGLQADWDQPGLYAQLDPAHGPQDGKWPPGVVVKQKTYRELVIYDAEAPNGIYGSMQVWPQDHVSVAVNDRRPISTSDGRERIQDVATRAGLPPFIFPAQVMIIGGSDDCWA